MKPTRDPLLFALCMLACTVFFSNGLSSAAREGARQTPRAIFHDADHQFLEELERASFRFFDEQADINTGLVCDKAPADGGPASGKASIASSGFALSGWAIATERGWVSRETAVLRVRQMLRFLAEKAPVKHGFYYHFMELDTGGRAWQCEVSTIDTSLFLAGAIVAREYFNDSEITDLVNRIYARIDWPWFLNGGDTLCLSWDDENGFSRYRWRTYSEHMVMSILGMGSPTKPLGADYWEKWERDVSTYGGQTYIHGASPLFIHQFSHAFIDFQNQRDAYADYYRNSVLATLAQRQFCIDMRGVFPTWGERLWGITASDSEHGYMAWGGPLPTMEGSNLDGTIVPCAAAGSLPFAPFEAMTTLRHMRETYGARVWKRYGFVDAFNPETKWTSPAVIGIDVGITLLQAENARTGFVWSLFMQAPEVRRALGRARFVSTERNLADADRAKLRQLAAGAWAAVAADKITPDTLGLGLTATISAHALGMIPSDEALPRLAGIVQTAQLPSNDAALAQFAAALVTLRQAFPQLSSEASRRLDEIDWSRIKPGSTELGSASRLAHFFKNATGRGDPQHTWGQFTRASVALDNVRVLAPADAADQFAPGLWLDERQILSGASASQLAYARIIARRANPAPALPITPLDAALLAEFFPTELIPYIPEIDLSPPDAPETGGDAADSPWRANAAANRAILFVSLANVLGSDCIRTWFAQDALAKAGYSRSPDFARPDFGYNNSIFSYHELGVHRGSLRVLNTDALPSASPASAWVWQTVAGLEYKDSSADVYPDDPEIKLRFAFTWDDDALHFHAEATDTPPGYKKPENRHEMVELFLNPLGDGFQWHSTKDRQFTFMSDGRTLGFAAHSAARIAIERTPSGYTIEAAIPWAEIGAKPASGMVLGATAAIYAGGPLAHMPALKLNWCYQPLGDGRAQLGTMTLRK